MPDFARSLEGIEVMFAALVEDPSTRRSERTREHRQGRRFASAVRSDEPGNFVPLNLDGDL